MDLLCDPTTLGSPRFTSLEELKLGCLRYGSLPQFDAPRLGVLEIFDAVFALSDYSALISNFPALRKVAFLGVRLKNEKGSDIRATHFNHAQLTSLHLDLMLQAHREPLSVVLFQMAQQCEGLEELSLRFTDIWETFCLIPTWLSNLAPSISTERLCLRIGVLRGYDSEFEALVVRDLRPWFSMFHGVHTFQLDCDMEWGQKGPH